MSWVFLQIGVIATPFYELLIRGLPFAIVQVPDTRIGKSTLSMWLALAVGLTAIYAGQIKKCQNKWLILLIAYIPLSIHLAPRFHLVINQVDSSNYWTWKPFLFILTYFLMFIAVQSMSITRQSFRKIINIMAWCGMAMSVYVIFQYFGWRQFYPLREGAQFIHVTKPGVVGTLGNSTLVSPFIAMIIPMALYSKRYLFSVVMACAVVCASSTVAIGAMIVSLTVYSLLRWRLRAFLLLIIVIMALSSAIYVSSKVNPDKFNKISSKMLSDNGRFDHWKAAINILKTKKIGDSERTHPYTGIGLGSYDIIMKPILGTTFGQAHNDYLQLTCVLGFGGLFLFLGSIGFMFKGIFHALLNQYNEAEITALTSSFICIALVAGASFVWQLAPYQFYTVLIVGLLHNSTLIKEDL